jgi:hypothetical protein
MILYVFVRFLVVYLLAKKIINTNHHHRDALAWMNDDAYDWFCESVA